MKKFASRRVKRRAFCSYNDRDAASIIKIGQNRAVLGIYLFRYFQAEFCQNYVAKSIDAVNDRKNMAEDEEDLSKRLAKVLDEIREVMEKRKTRIESLRQEIADIERDNEELEKTIADLLATFN